MTSYGYLGPQGTFSDEAVRVHRAGSDSTDAELCPYQTIDRIISSLVAGGIDRAVVPIENNLGGGVDEAGDALIRSDRLVIYAEIVLPVRHCLISATVTSLAAIRCVLSHPQALSQCREWLDRYLPHAERMTAASTAYAVASLSPEMLGMAAIGSALAAEVYQRHVVAQDVQGVNESRTRFVALARLDDPSAPRPVSTGRDRTSLVIAVPNRPGGLVRALGVFDALDINITRIESRPLARLRPSWPTGLGDAVMLLDVEGHRDDVGLAAALQALSRKVEYLRIAGSYPRTDAPTGMTVPPSKSTSQPVPV